MRTSNMRLDDPTRLRHMLDAAEDAVRFCRGKSLETFKLDRMLSLSVIQCLQILGEAAGKISPQMRDLAPEIPWSDVIGLRNRLIHAYFDVNLDIVWGAAQKRLPPLIASLEKLLDKNS